MKSKFITGILTSSTLIVLLPLVAFAHVIVTPNQAGIGQELTFNVSVPNERDTVVTNLKLVIPSGVTDVVPTTKDGWTITTTSNGSSSDPGVTSIVWNDGTIPVGQRQDFSFSAQVPGTTTTLDWKAYQTYGDGTIVHWDQTPTGSDDSVGNAGPYSVTKVINDLTSSTTSGSSPNTTLGIVLSIVALVISVSSLFIRRKKR
jgi:uncharacterized protein YcnI